MCEIAFLNDKKINLQREFKATLLKLERKGAIIIKNENNKICFYKTGNKVLVKDSEKYVYDYIFSQEKQNFSFNKWILEIKKEMLKDKIIEDKKDNRLTETYFLSTSFIFICFMIIFIVKLINNINDNFFDSQRSTIIGFLFAFMLLLPINLYEKRTECLNVKLTQIGWFYKYEVDAFKEFITEFTRLKEINIKEYPLWKDYLIYAFSLNINFNHEKLPDTNMNLLNSLEIKQSLEELIYNLTKK